MELKITSQAKEFLENKVQNSPMKKIGRFLIKIMEKYFNTPLLLEIPSEIQSIDPEFLKAIETAEKLQQLGILKRIEKKPKNPDEPFVHKYSASSETRANAGGADFFSNSKALWKSIGEVAERYLWFQSDVFFKNKTINAPYKKINQQALNILKLAGFSEKQKSENPILKFNEDTYFRWIPAISISPKNHKKTILCPIQLVSCYYCEKNVKTPRQKMRKEPMLRWIITTGVATAKKTEEAVVKGILEVIERDAFMISYLNKISPPVIDLEYLSLQDEELDKIIKDFKRYGLEIYVLKLPTDFPVNVIASVIIDRTGIGPAFTIGNSADFDLKNAILDSLSECLSIRLSTKRRLHKKIREDKKRLGRFERLIYWSRLENLSKIIFFTEGKKVKIDLSIQENLFNIKQGIKSKKYYQDKLNILRNNLKNKNYEACYVDLSDFEIKNLGLRCVQVVIPELQPMHLEETIPYISGKRIKEVPKKLGYNPAEKLNQEPHPFC